MSMAATAYRWLSPGWRYPIPATLGNQVAYAENVPSHRDFKWAALLGDSLGTMAADDILWQVIGRWLMHLLGDRDQI